jgi:predicted metal-binding membrane protein
MTETTSYDFTHLAPADAHLGRIFARPRTIAVGCVVVLAGLGWFYLALLTAAPGNSGLATMQALCRAFPEGASNLSTFGVTISMWSAMTLAMMLPSAAPMILTYAEIAETAARKSEQIVSPLAIVAGYASVWLVFSFAAAIAQIAFARAVLLEPGTASRVLAGVSLIGAGAYQFSVLKHACLARCQHPFPFFFANWSTTSRGVFRLGVRQGFYCLGCCWAMMLVTFAVGVMNIVWMAALAAVMTIEKLQTGRRFSYGVGTALIVAGVAMASVAGQWQ